MALWPLGWISERIGRDNNMALTTNQLNAHLRTTIVDQFAAEQSDREALLWLLKACIRHNRLGGADNIEAAQTIARLAFQQVIGRLPTAADLHLLRNHIALDADPTAGGIL